MSKNQLDELWLKGKEFLGTNYAIMGGAMSWVSESNLVSATSNAGAFGVLACGSMSADMLKEEIKKTQEKTSNPFGVNLIVMHPDLDSLVDVCIETKITHIVLAGGLPSGAIITKIKENNIKSIAFIPNIAIAKRLIRSGVDAFIIEGSEAGGHIGSVSTTVLAQEILLQMKESIIFVAGGIATGESMLSYLKMGASGVQIGTPLVCAEESIAHEKFKNAFIKANSRDAQITQQVDNDFPVIPVRAIVNKGSKDFIDLQKRVITEYKENKISKYDAQMKIEHYWAGALRKAVIDGDIEYGSLMAGQSVGLVKEVVPTSQIIENLIKQALTSL